MCASRLSTAYTVVLFAGHAERFARGGARVSTRAAGARRRVDAVVTLPFLTRNARDEGSVLSVVQSSIPAVLRERASLQPNDAAFTYVDYDQDWDGVTQTLTWSQLYRRVVNLGEQLRARGSTGDRALILAPQGLDYVLGFLGALQAGLVAVPLSVPYGGAHDERTISVLADTSPAVVLTTSAVIDNVSASVQSQQGQSAPSIVEVDLLDLDSRQRPAGPRPRAGANEGSDFIYLAVHVRVDPDAGGRHGVQQKRLCQFRADHERLFRARGRGTASGHRGDVVAAPLPRHGTLTGNHHADSGGHTDAAQQPGGLPAATGPVDAIAGAQRLHGFGGTKLRFRARGAQDVGRRHGRARPRGSALDSQRQRARPAGDPEAIRRPVRPLQFRPPGVSALLWHGGSDGVHSDPSSGRTARDRSLRFGKAARRRSGAM